MSHIKRRSKTRSRRMLGCMRLSLRMHAGVGSADTVRMLSSGFCSQVCLNGFLSEESLAIGLKWFSNVKELYLNWSKFTFLPECIKECHFLWNLVVNNCENLQEIKGIPQSLRTFSAFNCISLNPSCTRKLLNQVWISFVYLIYVLWYLIFFIMYTVKLICIYLCLTGTAYV
jgi:hypothetical protein